MRHLLVAALVLAACRDKPEVPPASPGSGSAAAVDPWSAPTAKAAETPVSRQQRAEAALGLPILARG